MYINKIVKLKNDKYKLKINDTDIIIYSDVIIKYNLLYKKSIDNKLYREMLRDNKYYDVYNKCVKTLLKKRKSEKEVLIYLDKFDLNMTDKTSIIAKLKDIKLIDDLSFTKAFINDKIYLSKKGKNVIKKELIDKGISIDLIDKELNNINVEDINNNLEKIISKKIKTNKKYSNNYFKQKLINELVNDGYSRDIIIEILEKQDIDDKTILENEFDKLYIKLSKKYIGHELENAVRQKLLIKGFKYDDINYLLNKKTED